MGSFNVKIITAIAAVDLLRPENIRFLLQKDDCNLPHIFLDSNKRLEETVKGFISGIIDVNLDWTTLIQVTTFDSGLDNCVSILYGLCIPEKVTIKDACKYAWMSYEELGRENYNCHLFGLACNAYKGNIVNDAIL